MSNSSKLTSLIAECDFEDLFLSTRFVAVCQKGHWSEVNDFKTNEAELRLFAQDLAQFSESTLNLVNPSLDAFVPGLKKNTMLRVHVVIPPLSPDGTQITLRRLDHAQPYDLGSFTKSEQIKSELQNAITDKKSILIAGATGAGKTSLLTSLMTLIPSIDRVLILEDSPELPMIPKLCTRLLARGNRFGFTQGATWDLGHLVFEALRMRPTRLILGECRGAEALGIARALQTGHGGIMSTVHAGSAREALARFAELAQISNKDLGWDLVVHLAINKNQEREITEALWTRAF